jgi:hypothetical protein
MPGVGVTSPKRFLPRLAMPATFRSLPNRAEPSRQRIPRARTGDLGEAGRRRIHRHAIGDTFALAARLSGKGRRDPPGIANRPLARSPLPSVHRASLTPAQCSTAPNNPRPSKPIAPSRLPERWRATGSRAPRRPIRTPRRNQCDDRGPSGNHPPDLVTRRPTSKGDEIEVENRKGGTERGQTDFIESQNNPIPASQNMQKTTDSIG